MPISIGSNISSLQVQRKLSSATDKLSSVFERLSSGQRINRASDDAAGLAIASSLSADLRVYSQGIRNLNDGISSLTIAEKAISSLTGIVTRQRELATQAANGTFSLAQRISLNTEAQALAAEYERTLATTEFNGMKLLDGSNPSIFLQAGYGEDAILEADILQNEVGQITEVTGLGTYTNYDRTFGVTSGTLEFGPQFAVADFNNDGIDDIVAVRAETAGAGLIATTIGFFLGEDGGTTFTLDDTVSYFSAYGGALTSVDVRINLEDVGNDGDTDVRILTEITSGLPNIANSKLIKNEMVPTGTFNMVNAGNSINVFGDQLTAIAGGDFNNDGVQDRVRQAGATSEARIRIQDTNTNITQGLVIQSLEQDRFLLTTEATARSAMDAFADNIDMLSQAIARIGASQSRVNTAANVLLATNENIAAARSRIMDVDIASETSELVRLNILQQSGAAVIAQANQQPTIALDLISGIR